jgi:hypothetical protein
MAFYFYFQTGKDYDILAINNHCEDYGSPRWQEPNNKFKTVARRTSASSRAASYLNGLPLSGNGL